MGSGSLTRILFIAGHEIGEAAQIYPSISSIELQPHLYKETGLPTSIKDTVMSYPCMIP